tara:strand:+ start:7131 stop:7286 length:156 start_codon:yes stop_codon:yes gene_type:complete
MEAKMQKERLEQLKAERINLQMRIAELNFLIQGYEAALKEQEEKAKTKKDD